MEKNDSKKMLEKCITELIDELNNSKYPYDYDDPILKEFFVISDIIKNNLVDISDDEIKLLKSNYETLRSYHNIYVEKEKPDFKFHKIAFYRTIRVILDIYEKLDINDKLENVTAFNNMNNSSVRDNNEINRRLDAVMENLYFFPYEILEIKKNMGIFNEEIFHQFYEIQEYLTEHFSYFENVIKNRNLGTEEETLNFVIKMENILKLVRGLLKIFITKPEREIEFHKIYRSVSELEFSYLKTLKKMRKTLEY